MCGKIVHFFNSCKCKIHVGFTLAAAASALCVEQKKPLGSAARDLVNQIICIQKAKGIYFKLVSVFRYLRLACRSKFFPHEIFKHV